MSLAPSSTVPLPEAEQPAARRRRGGRRGSTIAFLVGLVLPVAAVAVADRTGSPLAEAPAEEPEPVSYLAGDRLERALAALVAEGGSSTATQLALSSDAVSADLRDPLTGQFTRVDQYRSDSVDAAYRSDLSLQPPAAAAFDLAAVPAAELLGALQTANQALGNEDDDLPYLELLVERPFPAYGDPVIVVDDGYGVPHRAWLALDGTLLRVEGQ